jgi:hypothetical protein
MEKFKKFDVSSQEGIEELNDFCSRIIIIVKDVLSLGDYSVLVKYEDRKCYEPIFICPFCIHERRNRRENICKREVAAAKEQICEVCNTKYQPYYYYTKLPKYETRDTKQLGEAIYNFIKVTGKNPLVFLASNKKDSMNLSLRDHTRINPIEYTMKTSFDNTDIISFKSYMEEENQPLIMKLFTEFYQILENLTISLFVEIKILMLLLI